MISDQWRTELETRRKNVWAIIQQHECDAGLVFGSQGHGEPFRYLTNFVPALGDMWGILSGANTMACVLNFHWQLIEASEFSGIEQWYGIFDSVPTVADILAAVSPRRVAVIGLHRLPVMLFEALKARLPGVTFIDIGEKVALLRRHKSPLEIQMLREAARITDVVLATARAELHPGLTEYEVAAKLSYTAQSAGAEWAFPPTVISGNNHPIMIRLPTDRRLQAGDSVMVDVGAAYQGYQADATRTFVLGKPNTEQQKVWDTILRAYDAVITLIRPGVIAIDLHRAAVKVIEQAGYQLIHRIGHGIGLATSFEWPSLNSESGPLLPGTTICIEPGIYVPGAGNMKLEDDLVITETGFEFLTTSSKELMIP